MNDEPWSLILSFVLLQIIMWIAPFYFDVPVLNYGLRISAYLAFMIFGNAWLYFSEDPSEEDWILFNALLFGCLVLINAGAFSSYGNSGQGALIL